MDTRFAVLADDREREGPVVAALRRHPSVTLEVARLPAGDYRVDDTLLVERKTLTDLAASAEELAGVPGIGKATAELIRWAVEEPVADYAVRGFAD